MDRAELTPQELEVIEILTDPIVFAKHHFDWDARWYQAEMLRNPSLRKVSRCGRRIGKCILGDSKVITEGGPVKVKDLHDMDTKPGIISFDESSQKIINTSNYSVMQNGTKPSYKITTKTGRTNYATGNHPYLTIDDVGELNWIELDNMLVGDRIAVPSTYEGMIEGTNLGIEKARLLGYLCGDGGTSGKSKVTFTNFDESVVEDFRNIIEHYDCMLKKDDKDGNYYITQDEWHKNRVLELSRLHELQGKLATEKSAPLAIMAGTEGDISNFIGAYWDCDGWISHQSKTYDSSHKYPAIEIGIGSSSKNLARDTQHLLLRLGISATLKEKKVKYNGEYRKSWQVTIHDRDNIIKFSQKIKLVSSKKDKLIEVLDILSCKNNKGNRQANTVPVEVWSYIKSKQKELGLTNMQVCGAKSRKDNMRLRTQSAISREKLAEYAKNLDDPYLSKLSTNDIIWDEVISIEYIGEKETYDLTVPETHTFIADDIISHNTDTICVHMLWYAFTHKKAVCLVAAPYENQVKLVFKRVREFMKESAEISQSIVQNTKHPEYIEFGNGSIIAGFTAGTKSGAAGGSMRGQSADWIYMDETDYLSDDDIYTISTIALERDDIGIWASSTPTGKRGKFYDWCMDAQGGVLEVPAGTYEGEIHTEFYFPSTVLPNWSEKMATEWKMSLSEEAWDHEVMANFGQETIGVFNKDALDRAKRDYPYVLEPESKAIRVIGVDWDRQICPYGVNCWKGLIAA